MDLLKKTQELCRLYEIKPARSKGQNFLIKEEIHDQIIVAADLKPDDIVLEVGPGLGFLTSRLAKIVKKVIAVELDDKLAEVLKIGLLSQGVNNVKVVNQNILDFTCPNRFANRSGRGLPILDLNPKFLFKIVANLPYNISSIFLRKFLSSENKPELMVLMLQKEVAERICALPGKMSLLAVSVQFYAKPEIVETVPSDCFWPKPKVGSAIVKIKPHPISPSQGEELITPSPCEGEGWGEVEYEKEFFKLVKIGFSARRKMLKNNLAAGYRMDQKIVADKIKMAGLSENCRPQELSVNDWLKLLHFIR